MPGSSTDSIDVNVTVDTLTITGEVNLREQGEALVPVRFSGRFFRQIRLPNNIVKDQIKASFNNGVMRIVSRGAKKADRYR